MLKNRIISTLKFFDLQDYPLTLLELRQFLLADVESFKPQLNENFELSGKPSQLSGAEVETSAILSCLDGELASEVGCDKGFYYLAGRQKLVKTRLNNYLYGIKREKIISRFLPALRHFPFVRGVAIGGSQAMGLQKPTSDIDLMLFVEHAYLWIIRPILVIYFQIFGIRRHGRFIADRICLNHYLTSWQEVQSGKDLYNAMEYLRLRPVVFAQSVNEFRLHNFPWINIFFPNFYQQPGQNDSPSRLQIFFEKCLRNRFFSFLSDVLQKWQLKRARRGSYVVVNSDELSFHSLERKRLLLGTYFKNPSGCNSRILAQIPKKFFRLT